MKKPRSWKYRVGGVRTVHRHVNTRRNLSRTSVEGDTFHLAHDGIFFREKNGKRTVSIFTERPSKNTRMHELLHGLQRELHARNNIALKENSELANFEEIFFESIFQSRKEYERMRKEGIAKKIMKRMPFIYDAYTFSLVHRIAAMYPTRARLVQGVMTLYADPEMQKVLKNLNRKTARERVVMSPFLVRDYRKIVEFFQKGAEKARE